MFPSLRLYNSTFKSCPSVTFTHHRFIYIFFFPILLKKNIRVTYDKWKFYHMNIISDSQSYNIRVKKIKKIVDGKR